MIQVGTIAMINSPITQCECALIMAAFIVSFKVHMLGVTILFLAYLEMRRLPMMGEELIILILLVKIVWVTYQLLMCILVDIHNVQMKIMIVLDLTLMECVGLSLVSIRGIIIDWSYLEMLFHAKMVFFLIQLTRINSVIVDRAVLYFQMR